MGIDQHKKYSYITVIDEAGDIVEEGKLYRQDKVYENGTRNFRILYYLFLQGYNKYQVFNWKDIV